MTKAELIEEVAKKADISKADAERTIAAFFELVVASTKKGDKVAWPGFGSFSTTRRKERTGRNPQTGWDNDKSSRKLGSTSIANRIRGYRYS